MMQLGGCITGENMEIIAKRYLKLNTGALYRHKGNKQAYHREIIAKWARNHGSQDQIRVTTRLHRRLRSAFCYPISHHHIIIVMKIHLFR